MARLEGWVAKPCLALLALVITLAGCRYEGQCFEEKPYTALFPMMVGKITILMPQTHYRCTRRIPYRQ